MKHNLLQIILVLVVTTIVGTSFTFKKKVDLSRYKIVDEGVCYNVPNKNEDSSLASQTIEYRLFLGKTYVGFKEALGFKESQGRYTVVNQYGYMGKYQFGKSTLKMIGIYNSSNFLNDARLQEEAFSAYTARNKWILRRDIKRYVGRYMSGVKVTESGILAAAHLAGAGNVKKYLRSGGVDGFQDANGTSIRYYLKKFSGYDTSFIIANRKAKASVL